MEFYDIAGLVKGANKGEGLGNQFLTHIRETQAIIVVLRVFENPDIIHVENSVDPLRDLEIINTELILKDLETVEKRLAKAEGEARSGKKEAVQDRDELLRVKKSSKTAICFRAIRNLMIALRANERMKDLNLLTAKRQIYLLNGKAEEVTDALA